MASGGSKKRRAEDEWLREMGGAEKVLKAMVMGKKQEEIKDFNLDEYDRCFPKRETLDINPYLSAHDDKLPLRHQIWRKEFYSSYLNHQRKKAQQNKLSRLNIQEEEELHDDKSDVEDPDFVDLLQLDEMERYKTIQYQRDLARYNRDKKKSDGFDVGYYPYRDSAGFEIVLVRKFKGGEYPSEETDYVGDLSHPGFPYSMEHLSDFNEQDPQPWNALPIPSKDNKLPLYLCQFALHQYNIALHQRDDDYDRDDKLYDNVKVLSILKTLKTLDDEHGSRATDDYRGLCLWIVLFLSMVYRFRMKSCSFETAEYWEFISAFALCLSIGLTISTERLDDCPNLEFMFLSFNVVNFLS
ncbi:hypothetical protein POM88_018466 [Heracleum sosnowskyi]|uniref:Uncharacterized protein n=1 Tax=Heracleum sosnowskyi TaxID=360622 RepID=A0AAD8N0E9_9APIA|nr:hypothetical protein POM88_018466 [Heracleum sosnowskyi]